MGANAEIKPAKKAIAVWRRSLSAMVEYIKKNTG